MKIRTGLTGDLHTLLLPTPLRNYRPTVLNIRSRHSHCNVSDMGFWTHSSWVMQYTVHWPGEYPPTPPSPHSLDTFQVSRYGNWNVCSWVGESGAKNNACNANDKPPSWVHYPSADSVTRFTRGRVRELKNAHYSVAAQNRTHVYMKFLSQRPRKSPPAVMSTSRETLCIYNLCTW